MIDCSKTFHISSHLQHHQLRDMPLKRSAFIRAETERFISILRGLGVPTLRVVYGDRFNSLFKDLSIKRSFKQAQQETTYWQQGFNYLFSKGVDVDIYAQDLTDGDVLWVRNLYNVGYKNKDNYLITPNNQKHTIIDGVEDLLEGLYQKGYRKPILTGVNSSGCVSKYARRCLDIFSSCRVPVELIGDTFEPVIPTWTTDDYVRFNKDLLKMSYHGSQYVMNSKKGGEVHELVSLEKSLDILEECRQAKARRRKNVLRFTQACLDVIAS